MGSNCAVSERNRTVNLGLATQARETYSMARSTGEASISSRYSCRRFNRGHRCYGQSQQSQGRRPRRYQRGRFSGQAHALDSARAISLADRPQWAIWVTSVPTRVGKTDTPSHPRARSSMIRTMRGEHIRWPGEDAGQHSTQEVVSLLRRQEHNRTILI